MGTTPTEPHRQDCLGVSAWASLPQGPEASSGWGICRPLTSLRMARPRPQGFCGGHEQRSKVLENIQEIS